MILKPLIRTIVFCILGLTAAGARAADVTSAPGYDWTGFYLGAQGGYGWGQADYEYRETAGSSSTSIDNNGFVGGGTLGYNFQTGDFVFGLEADASYANVSGDEKSNQAPCYVEGCSADVNWFGTGRARLGYAFDNVMPFVTGGVALAGIEGKADLGACGFVGNCGFDDTRWGWTAGGGIEWGFAEHWSAKAEYLYVAIAGTDITPPAPYGHANAEDLDFSVARLGINYRF